ncbi:MAG: transglycosylase domain-containing protein [Thermodesulfobacteriota bacterium]
MKNFLPVVFKGSLVCLVLSIIAAVSGYYWFVMREPGEAISQGSIENILTMESPVYYSDGSAKIGVFFEEAHRQYLSYQQVPKDFVHAIVASEDHDFFSHNGVDFKGLGRAMLANLKAGRVVQGGSTITQQTAKNLFKRQGRSIQAKLKELLFALRLEHHYPKEKILEFYANQFFVSGNGRGLGVAARYYFDKEATDLSLVEAAFIAGSVKRPNYYNPHIKKTEEAMRKAQVESKHRAAYVLGQMYKLHYIDANEYQRALNQEIPFKQGRTRYSLNTVMDLVKDAMADPIIEDAFVRHGIDNIATSGIKVVTTIDKDLQESSLYSLKRELSRLDIRLTGYERKLLQETYEAMSLGSTTKLHVGQFLLAQVEKIDKNPVKIQLSLGDKANEDPLGIIDGEGLQVALTALVRHKRQRWSMPVKGDLAKVLLKEIKKGDRVYVSVREVDQLSGGTLFNLEKYPEVQGAVISLQNGKIRSMVGGMTNHYFNRAVTAKRPMGSVIKPLVYAAALQLGWNSLDALNNERAMFVYHDEPYFPRPDHKSPHAKVSMSWAGVHSENLATVWLVAHLCDKLTPGQFKEVLSHLGMGQEDGESYNHYMRRVRDEMGIVVDKKALQDLAFEQALLTVESDLIFDGQDGEVEFLHKMHFSKQYAVMLEEEEAAREENSEKGDQEQEEELTKAEIAELKLRKDLARWSFEHLQEQYAALLRLKTFPDATLEEYVPNFYYVPMAAKANGAVTQDFSRYEFIFSEQQEPGWRPVTSMLFSAMVGGMLPADKEKFWSRVRIDNLITVSTLELVAAAMDKELKRFNSLEPYSPEVLHSLHDFRILVGLQYLIGLCREFGVESGLEPVLSFPLGSNVVSLYEVVRMYEGITSGKVHTIDGQQNAGLDLIARIETYDGEVVYTAKPFQKRVIDNKTTLAVNDILRNVVKFGTGRYAYRNIQLHSRDPELESNLLEMGITVPVLGKTGTANRFSNASFAGLVPGSYQGRENGVALHNGLVLAAYVGYDDNKPMVRRTTHITGASGALPIWTRVAASHILNRDYGKALDLADLSFSGTKELPLFYPEVGQIEVPVAVRGGGMLVTGAEGGQSAVRAPLVTFGEILPGGEVKPQRAFRPYWLQ